MIPIIIIGAVRSGSNILRDTLTTLNGVCTWDCDEIPYIWRYGNKKFPTDLLTPDMVSPKIKKYIRNQFEKISKRINCKYVIEKTCANSLRVDFVDKIVPDAKYIYLIRDGLDSTYSIMKRWESEFSLSYTLKKLKYVPKLDIPYHSIKYLNNRWFKKLNNGRLKFWGPNFMLEEELMEFSLEEISALQWVACIDSANQFFNNIDDKRVFRVRYEKFVSNPLKTTKEIARFIGISIEDNIALPSIRKSSVGKGKDGLSADQLKKILPIIKKTMGSNNYLCPENDL